MGTKVQIAKSNTVIAESGIRAQTWYHTKGQATSTKLPMSFPRATFDRPLPHLAPSPANALHSKAKGASVYSIATATTNHTIAPTTNAVVPHSTPAANRTASTETPGSVAMG